MANFYFSNDFTEAQLANILNIISKLEDESNSATPPAPPRIEILGNSYTTTQLSAMTWKQQFGTIATYMNTFILSPGITENNFNEYGYDYWMRSKFIAQGRVDFNGFVTSYNSAVTRCELLAGVLKTAFTATENASIASIN